MTNPYAPPPQRPDVEPDRRRTPDAGHDERPGADGGAPAPPKPSPETVRAVTRSVLRATGVTMAALLSTALPLPWQAAGTVLALAGVVLGVRALRAVRRAGLRRPLMPVVVASLAIAGLYLVSSLSVLATWPLQTQRQECLERALTVASRDACEAQFREAIERFSSGG